jgi:hypothetical protein
MHTKFWSGYERVKVHLRYVALDRKITLRRMLIILKWISEVVVCKHRIKDRDQQRSLMNTVVNREFFEYLSDY